MQENIDDFEMEPDEAVKEAAQQFISQGKIFVLFIYLLSAYTTHTFPPKVSTWTIFYSGFLEQKMKIVAHTL